MSAAPALTKQRPDLYILPDANKLAPPLTTEEMAEIEDAFLSIDLTDVWPEVEEFKTQAAAAEELHKAQADSLSLILGTEASMDTLFAFKDKKIAVLGNGALGGTASMHLLQAGAGNFTLMDPDTVSIANLSKQVYTYEDAAKKRFKVDALERLMKERNPYVNIAKNNIGLAFEDIPLVVAEHDIIIDAIDVGAFDLSVALHQEAKKQGKLVLVGYDMAGMGYFADYPYDTNPNLEVLDGKVTPQILEDFKLARQYLQEGLITEAEFNDFIIFILNGPLSPFDVPVEMLKYIANRPIDESKIKQAGVGSQATAELLTVAAIYKTFGIPTKGVSSIDVPSAVRKNNPSLLRRIPLMIQALHVLTSRGKKVQEKIKYIAASQSPTVKVEPVDENTRLGSNGFRLPNLSWLRNWRVTNPKKIEAIVNQDGES